MIKLNQLHDSIVDAVDGASVWTGACAPSELASSAPSESLPLTSSQIVKRPWGCKGVGGRGGGEGRCRCLSILYITPLC